MIEFCRHLICVMGKYVYVERACTLGAKKFVATIKFIRYNKKDCDASE